MTKVSLDRASPSHTFKENPEIATVKWLGEEGTGGLSGGSLLSPQIQKREFLSPDMIPCRSLQFKSFHGVSFGTQVAA